LATDADVDGDCVEVDAFCILKYSEYSGKSSSPNVWPKITQIKRREKLRISILVNYF
jgi:hypothetical protein